MLQANIVSTPHGPWGSLPVLQGVVMMPRVHQGVQKFAPRAFSVLHYPSGLWYGS